MFSICDIKFLSQLGNKPFLTLDKDLDPLVIVVHQ